MRLALRRRRGHAAIVVLCLMALVYFWSESRGRRTRGATREALRCQVHRQAIEQALVNWEQRYGRLPTDRTLWFDLDDRGTITYASPHVVGWCAKNRIPPAHHLAAGSTVLAALDARGVEFGCPRYVGRPGFPRGQVYFRFAMDPRGVATPSSRWRTRGVLCLMHGESGPPDDPDAVHGFDR